MEQRRKLWGEAREGREKEDKENLKVIGQTWAEGVWTELMRKSSSIFPLPLAAR